PFYKRFNLRPPEVKLDDKITKTYQSPTMYADVTVGIGIFLCSLEGAKRIMPHPKMQPVTMGGGRSLVIFSCYEYKHVMGVPAYNEIAMTIPILVNPALNIPILPMLKDKAFREFGYYVFSMPVTSKENMLRGHNIWGLPKVVQEIDLYEKDGFCVCAANEESGEPYFELSIPTSGEKVEFDVSSNLYSKFENRLLQSETNFKAAFNVNKYFKQLFTKMKPDKPYLKIYDTPSGKVLKGLGIDEHPFQFRFAKHMTACFDLPNKSYKPPFSF
ncbi:MAG TPA: acetoacetate decarboxylase family protein, partial [bacterium]|nr:acetoacetate decarboxylase family protein [bacterium]